MFRYAVLIIVFLLFTFSPQSQENKNHRDYSYLYRDAEQLFNSAHATEITDSLAMISYMRLAAILVQENKINDTLVDSYLKCGILEMSKSTQENAMSYFRRAIFFVGQNNKLPDSLLFKPFLYSGSVQYSLNNLDSAVYFYKKAESVNDRFPGLNESERLYNKFGALYFETGDYNKSISYFEKALSLVENKKPVNVFFVINYKNNIATALMKLGKNDQALEIFRELLRYEKPGDELLYNIGNTYFEKKDYSGALHWLRQIRTLNDEKYTSLIKVFIRQQQFDSAGCYLQKAEDLQEAGGSSKITKGILLKYAGDLQAAAGRKSEALKNYQQSIISLDPSFGEGDVNSNPRSFTGLQNFSFLFDALMAKGRVLYSMGEENWVSALGAYASALSLAGYIEKTYFSDDARLFLKARINPATQNAVDISIRLFNKTRDRHYVNEAFGFVENNKATVLQAGLKKLELSSIPGLPASLVLEEKKLRTLLARLNILTAQNGDSLSKAQLQKKIHDTEVSLAGVQDKLEENPVYHNLKFVRPAADLDSLQMNLRDNDEAILTYYHTDSSLICFYITKEETGFTAIPLADNLFTAIISLREELQSPDAAVGKYLRKAGSDLFQQLILPVYEKIKDKKRLVIIPYNETSYVPFEILINPADQSLLLNKYAISYNYSAGFLSENKEEKSVQYQVLAMAPFSKATDELILPVLPASAEEIRGLPGKKFLGAEAIKSQFTGLAAGYPVIHLATHAVANDSNLLGSYIEFFGLKKEADTTHRLYEQEIYALDLKSARLVILSACETGNGLLVNGEGVMSLSRAFSYAGCKSVITSLWKADELSTSFICKKLHYYLQKGLAIDRALQKAKIDYLESSEIEDRYKRPEYWAHLVLIGNDRPVVEQGVNWLLWGGLISGCALLMFLFRKKVNRA